MTSRYVALLRSVNVGGRGSLKMDALREAFTGLGYADVVTYIQSGNVVFTSTGPVAADDLGAALSAALGADLTVMLRTGADLAEVLAADPFGSAPRSARHIGFLSSEPPAAVVDGLDLARFAPEEAAILGAEVHLLLPDGMGRAKLPQHLARVLADAVTYRNWNTASKLAELAVPV